MEIGDLHIDVERKPIKHIHLAVYPPDGRVALCGSVLFDGSLPC